MLRGTAPLLRSRPVAPPPARTGGFGRPNRPPAPEVPGVPDAENSLRPDRPAQSACSARGAPGGFSLFVKDGVLRCVHDHLGRGLYGVSSDVPVPAGRHELRFEFEPTGPPELAIVVNPRALTGELNPGSPVTLDYVGPFAFTGTPHSVTVDVSGELISDDEAELRVHMARQWRVTSGPPTGGTGVSCRATLTCAGRSDPRPDGEAGEA